MAKKRINEILSLSSRQELTLRIKSGVEIYSLLLSYKLYSEEDKETIKAHIQKEMKFIYSTKPMGHKNEPYYETEDEMCRPTYTWETLPENEKNFFNNYKAEQDGKN